MSLKFKETNFDEYLISANKNQLHPKLNPIYKNIKKINPNINEISNLIFYGVSGVGKYTQLLIFLKYYSPSQLKYEKKMHITVAKQNYTIKVSDIHYEVDLSLLGCNSKILWHEIYMQIMDSIIAKDNKTGIIVCKNFHCIHNELLEIFYSYMQKFKEKNITIKFIFITEHISFIPSNILNSCLMISVPQPTKINLNKCINLKQKQSVCVEENIKYAFLNKSISYINNSNILINKIINYETTKFNDIRELLYNMLILDLNILDCIWYIFSQLIIMNKINNEDVHMLLIRFYVIIQRYNNNYRPIMHLESFIFILINTIHGLKSCKDDS